jgi:hypothetical protein
MPGGVLLKTGIIGRQGILLKGGLQPLQAKTYARLLKALEVAVKRIFLAAGPVSVKG